MKILYVGKTKKIKIILDKVLKEKGISKYELAKRLNSDSGNVAKYFRKGYTPSLKTLVRWAEALDCKVCDFIEEWP